MNVYKNFGNQIVGGLHDTFVHPVVGVLTILGNILGAVAYTAIGSAGALHSATHPATYTD